MRLPVLACLIASIMSPAVHAQTAPPPLPEKTPLRARLADDAIRDAIKQTLAEQKKETALQTGKALSGDRYEQFGRDMSDVRLPDCLHADGLRYQPTFFLGGVLALPFIAVAALRGKCR